MVASGILGGSNAKQLICQGSVMLCGVQTDFWYWLCVAGSDNLLTEAALNTLSDLNV